MGFTWQDEDPEEDDDRTVAAWAAFEEQLWGEPTPFGTRPSLRRRLVRWLRGQR